MRSFSTKTILAAAALLISAFSVQAQTVNQVIIGNGGVFGSNNYVKVAAWSPQADNYFVFDSIKANSVQDVLIEGNMAWVGADDSIRAYNIDNYSTIATAYVPGVRQMAIYKDNLVVTRGFPVSSDFVKVYDKSTLTEISSIAGLPAQCQGIAIVEDSAYVTVPGPYASGTGALAMVNLASNSLIAVMDMDTVGDGIYSIAYHPGSNSLYTLNDRFFGSGLAAATTLPIGSRTPVTSDLTVLTAGTFSFIHNDRLYANLGGNFTALELPALTLVDPAIVPGTFAGGVFNSTDNQMLLTQTDYFSYGRLETYSATGSLLDTLRVGISPEALDIDYRIGVHSESPFSPEIYITAFPNPVTTELQIDLSRLKSQPGSIELIDLQGRVFLSQKWNPQSNTMDVAELPAGAYFLRVRTDKGDYLKPIIKQ